MGGLHLDLRQVSSVPCNLGSCWMYFNGLKFHCLKNKDCNCSPHKTDAIQVSVSKVGC